ncbi:MAG: DUF3047 domain-containing protein [Victivallales bacterium]|nr:DUF3047 domain-containing protein [Victivallales bacterium]
MIKIFTMLAGSVLGIILVTGAAAGEAKSGYRIDFSRTETRNGHDFPKGWAEKGTKWGVPNTRFYIRKDRKTNSHILVVEANKATGAILYDIYRHVNLSQTPIMRWRWRVKELPVGADGRNKDKDDQALAVYLGTGNLIRKSIAYRWETETPIGASGNVSYGSGMIKVAWFCLQNKTVPAGEWVISQRNVAEDFKKIYGEIPQKFVVSIGGNSQYTQSRALGELDYIEFLPAAAAVSRDVASTGE